MRYISTVLLLFASMTAFAIPVTWTLDAEYYFIEDLSSSNSISGSFTYDADTNVYSDVSISGYFGDYSDDNLCWWGGSHSQELNLCLGDDSFNLELSFSESLSNSDGEVALTTINDFVNPTAGSGEIVCDGLEGCGGLPGEYETFIVGSVVGSVVPIPAAVWLFGSALAGLGWFRRKQTV